MARPNTASRLSRTGLTAALVAALVLSAPAPAFASKLPTDKIDGTPLSAGEVSTSLAPDVYGKAGTLMVPGGRRLWSRAASTERRMASTTKIMTAIVVLESCNLTETVTITKTAATTPYRLGLRTGEKRSVRKLLELLLVCSSNDAATALAIHTGGSVSGFAKMMNARAAKMGLTHTHFVNPHGLDTKGHYSSAADLNTMMRAAVRNEEFKRIIKMRSVYFPTYKTRRGRWIASTDKLLGQVEGLRGGKTGFTNDAMYCFVANARRDGVSLTSVVLGCSSSSARFTASKRLLEWGFKHYKVRTLCTTSTVGSVPISNVPSTTVSVRPSKITTAPVLDVLGSVKREVSLVSSVTAPVAQGQQLGVVTFRQDGSVIATVAAVAVTNVAGPSPIDLVTGALAQGWEQLTAAPE